MHASSHHSLRGEQEFAPLLFSLSAGDGAAAATPRAVTPHRGREDSSMSGQRRSATTPGSVHTETTPPTPPPPVMRLMDDVVMDEPSSSKGGRMAAVPPPMQSLTSPMVSAAERDESMQYEQLQYGDVWVTVFGFSQQETPLILGELSKCGDILQWGTFGQASANYIHLQYQSKYAAQRALLRNGEQLSPALIIGIKPTDMRHRMAIEQYQAAGGEAGQPLTLTRPTVIPERSYRIEAQPQVTLPQPRSTMSKVFEYVLGF